MKRALVTGATGFIGRHVLPRLLEKDYKIHAVSSRPAPVEGEISWHQANLLDNREITQLMADVRPTHLLHLAWYAHPGAFWHAVENFAWLQSSITLLRRFGENGGRRIVMAGTCAEYDWDYGYCSETVTPLRPSTPYGVCKNALQETLHAYCCTAGISGAWGRIFFLYGPGEHPKRLMASVIDAILKGQTARCTHGNQVRDYLHVMDVAAAFAALLDSGAEGPVNIASGQPVTVKTLVLQAAECLGRNDLVDFGAIAAPEAEPPFIVGDHRRMQRLTDWRPALSYQEGIAQTVASFMDKTIQ